MRKDAVVKICLKDKELIEFSLNSDYYNVLVNDKNLLPYALRKDFSLRRLDKWLLNRAIPLSRENAKWILNEMGLPQGDPLVVVLECRALTLTDSYWVKLKDTDSWDAFNLYKNKFSEALRDIAIEGYSSVATVRGDILTPEATTQGSYAKCWDRLEDGIYLFKSNALAKESEAEFVASLLADKLNIPHVHYDLVNYKNRVCSKCKNICSEDVSICSMLSYATIYNGDSYMSSVTDWVAFLPKEWHKDFYEMLVFDVIIGNKDRHLNNWGVWYDANTGKEFGLHPLFDHNCAIDIRDREMFLKRRHSSMKNNTYLEAAVYALSHLPKDFLLRMENLQNWYSTNEAKTIFQNTYGRIDELEYLKYLMKSLLDAFNKQTSQIASFS